MFSTLHDLWAYRGFIYASVVRDFEMRYQNSLLGVIWTFLNPLAMILVYTLIFTQVMHARLPGETTPFSYSIYLMSGILPWGLFTEILNRGQGLFIENANLLKKINFPQMCLPIIALLGSLINFGIVFGLFLVFLVITNDFPGWLLWSFFPVLFVQVILAFGIALLLGILNVFFRDVGHMSNLILQFWFWLTPIVYVANFIPEPYRAWMALNPMAPIIEAYHHIFVFKQLPQWSSLLPTIAISVVILLLSWRLFQKRSGEMVDEL